jgi:hypothetical protein
MRQRGLPEMFKKLHAENLTCLIETDKTHLQYAGCVRFRLL